MLTWVSINGSLMRLWTGFVDVEGVKIFVMLDDKGNELKFE